MIKFIKAYIHNRRIRAIRKKYALYFSIAPYPSFELLIALQKLENEEINNL